MSFHKILNSYKNYFIQLFSFTKGHEIESVENFLKVPGTWPIFCSKLCGFFFVDITSFCINCKNVYQILGGERRERVPNSRGE